MGPWRRRRVKAMVRKMREDFAVAGKGWQDFRAIFQLLEGEVRNKGNAILFK